MVIIIWSLILLATTISFTGAYKTWNWGNSIIHRRDVVQDVTLAKRSNLNYYNELHVGCLTYDPLKRSFVQF